MEAILFTGIQGSGKTSFFREYFFETHVRISLDLLRTRNREWVLLAACLKAGQRFVIDNTNVTVADRARYICPSREAGFRVCCYFFEPDPYAAYARNALRPREVQVPAMGIFGTLKRLERPALMEGFDELFKVCIPEPGIFQVEPWVGTGDCLSSPLDQ